MTDKPDLAALLARAADLLHRWRRGEHPDDDTRAWLIDRVAALDAARRAASPCDCDELRPNVPGLNRHRDSCAALDAARRSASPCGCGLVGGTAETPRYQHCSEHAPRTPPAAPECTCRHRTSEDRIAGHYAGCPARKP